ncbi:MAG: hypothetical protein RLZZ196_2246 [Bacteroidota bacterium]|jgi:hypothetical protein
MALKINADVVTSEGFTVQPFVFLDIQLYKPFSRALLTYYKDEASYQEGKSSVSVNLPSLVDVPLTYEEFFGPNLAMLFHDKAIEEIEKTTGPGTVVVIEDAKV